MQLHKRRSGQAGISLMETMVALVVIVVGLAALQHAFPQGVAMGRLAMDRTQATLLARGQLEQLRLHQAQAPSTPGDRTPAPFLDSQNQTTFERFRWHAEVLPVATDLVEVRMQVVWPWPQPKHHVQLATYVSQD